jgi:hypothetical protein
MSDNIFKKVSNFKIDKIESKDVCFINPLLLFGIFFLICLFMFFIGYTIEDNEKN